MFLTATALSHRIKKLEQQLNIQLFERRTRSISLTPEGEYLLKHVQSGFGQIQTALFQLEQNKQRLFTITTTPSFASEWIIPYLPELQSRFPNIMFRVHASYDLINMTSGLYDLAIRYGSGGYQGVDAELFAVDEYVAVGHPSLDIATMYHNGMNFIFHNEATLYPQRSVVDDVVVTNQSNQSGKGCVTQQQRQPLTPNIVARNDNVQDRIVYHRINPISQNVTIPNLPQRTNLIPFSTTMNFVLDNENMYHSGINSVLQNKATLYPQKYVVNEHFCYSLCVTPYTLPEQVTSHRQ